MLFGIVWRWPSATRKGRRRGGYCVSKMNCSTPRSSPTSIFVRAEIRHQISRKCRGADFLKSVSMFASRLSQAGKMTTDQSTRHDTSLAAQRPILPPHTLACDQLPFHRIGERRGSRDQAGMQAQLSTHPTAAASLGCCTAPLSCRCTLLPQAAFDRYIRKEPPGYVMANTAVTERQTS